MNKKVNLLKSSFLLLLQRIDNKNKNKVKYIRTDKKITIDK